MLAHVERHGKLYKVASLTGRSLALPGYLDLTRLYAWAFSDVYIPMDRSTVIRMPDNLKEEYKSDSYRSKWPAVGLPTVQFGRFSQHLKGGRYESRLQWAHSPGTCCCCGMAISICLSHTMLVSTRGSMVCARDFA